MWDKWNGHPWQEDKALAWSSLSSTVAARLAAGYRPTCVDARAVGLNVLATGLWEQRSGPEWKLFTVTEAALAQRLAAESGLGFRPVRVSSFVNAGTPTVIVIAEKWSGAAWQVEAGLDSAAFTASSASRIAAGWYPATVSGYCLRLRARRSAPLHRTLGRDQTPGASDDRPG